MQRVKLCRKWNNGVPMYRVTCEECWALAYFDGVDELLDGLLFHRELCARLMLGERAQDSEPFIGRSSEPRARKQRIVNDAEYARYLAGSA